MRPPFTLIEEGTSGDTIECLETLLEAARRGDLIGIAFAAMYKKRSYITHAAGEAHRNPTFARGMVATLDDLLARQVQAPK
jgi:hypothetical protein